MWARVLLNGQCLFIGTLLFILLQGQSLALDLALELGHGEEAGRSGTGSLAEAGFTPVFRWPDHQITRLIARRSG